MTVYRRFVRAKKGMSTIFGGLFFVILILMGFNLMLWGFIQYDNYNTTLRSMNQNDQLAISENLVPTNPGAQNFTATSFNIPVNNLGGTTVSIARIYITNVSPIGVSTHCTSSDPNSQGPCIVDTGTGTQNCAGNGLCSFTNGNVAAGVINQLIHVNGLTLNDGAGYKVILSSTRGRLFSFFYPWPVAASNGNNGGGNFVSNIGPLSIYFNYQSFNFTQGAQTTSQSAFCAPSNNIQIVFWVKIANNGVSAVTLKDTTVMQLQAYGVSGFGQFITIWIVNQTTVNPSNVIPYSNAQPTVLQPSPANGAPTFTLIKFGSTAQDGGAGTAPSFKSSVDGNWIMFMGFYYIYQGLTQGETIPFLDIKTTSGYPGTC